MKRKQSERPVFIGQNLYIRPTYIVSMPEYYGGSRYSSYKFLENIKNLDNNSHNGEVSKKSGTKIRNAINWLLIGAKPKRVYSKQAKKTFQFKVSLITLTLPDTDTCVTNRDFQVKLLNPFLVYCRKYYGLKNYVWKLELQKNGKIHAHLTVDCFMYYGALRRTWNRLLRRQGYLSAFERSFGHSNPNSTDVHSVKTVKNLGAYLAKYLSKDEGANEKINGRIWGCSYELSNANKASIHVSADECSQNLRCLDNPQIEYSSLESPPDCLGHRRKFGEIYFLNFTKWRLLITGELKQKFLEVRNSITSSVQYFDNVEFNSV